MSCPPIGSDPSWNSLQNSFVPQNVAYVRDAWYSAGLGTGVNPVYRWNGCIQNGDYVPSWRDDKHGRPENWGYRVFSFSFGAYELVQDEIHNANGFKWHNAFASRRVTRKPPEGGAWWLPPSSDRYGSKNLDTSLHVPTYFLDSLSRRDVNGNLLLDFEFDRHINHNMSTNQSGDVISAARLSLVPIQAWGFGSSAAQVFASKVLTHSPAHPSFVALPNSGKERSYFLNQYAINSIINSPGNSLDRSSLNRFKNTLQVSNADRLTLKLRLKNNQLDYLRRLDYKFAHHSSGNTLAPSSSLWPFRLWSKNYSGPGPNDKGRHGHPQHTRYSEFRGSGNPRFFYWYRERFQPAINRKEYIYDEDIQISFGNGFWTEIRSNSLPSNPHESKNSDPGIRMISYGNLSLPSHNQLFDRYGIPADKVLSRATAFLKIPSSGVYNFSHLGNGNLSVYTLSQSKNDVLEQTLATNTNLSLKKNDVLMVHLNKPVNRANNTSLALQWTTPQDNRWRAVPGDLFFLSHKSAKNSSVMNEIDKNSNDNVREIEVFSNYKIHRNLDHTFIEACLDADCRAVASSDSLTNIDQDTATPGFINPNGQPASDDLFTDYRREFTSNQKTRWKPDASIPAFGYVSSFELHTLQDLYAEPSESIRLRLGNPASGLIQQNILSMEQGRSLVIPLNDSSPSLSLSNS